MGDGAEEPTDEVLKFFREERMTQEKGFKEIGEFIYWFSQLEFTIKARIVGVLNIPDELFEPVTAPYDFAVLCSVAGAVLSHKFPTSKDQIEKFFKECLGLNTERVRIAHGMWTQGADGLVARHSARGKPVANYYYETPGEVLKLAQKAQRLMAALIEIPSEGQSGTP